MGMLVSSKSTVSVGRRRVISSLVPSSRTSINDLHDKKAVSLIIDLRDNGGGADELGKQLFSYLVTEPFPYYNDLVINKLTFDFYKYANNSRPIPADRVTKRPNG